MNKPTTPQHIAWIDLLRIIACFMVVLSHSCDFFVAKFDDDPSEFLQGAVWGSLMRACVPLFVMISGVLLLPIREDTGVFYKRRLGRIVWPLVFWSLVTPLFYYAYGQFNATQTTYHLLSWPVNFNYTTTPLWYLYMLVGIYLMMPVISPWLAQASRKDLKRFLYIWGVTLVLPLFQLILPMIGYQGNYGHMGILGVCDWNPFGTFYYFAGFLGYVVLAYYLKKYPLNYSLKEILIRAVPLFMAGYAITFGGFVWIQKLFPGDYAYLEILWFFTGVNVFLMTFAVFIVIQKTNITNLKWAMRLKQLAGLTFGIYLCHFFLVQLGYDFVYAYIPVAPILQIPIIAVLAFTASAIVVRLLKLIPKSKFLIG